MEDEINANEIKTNDQAQVEDSPKEEFLTSPSGEKLYPTYNEEGKPTYTIEQMREAFGPSFDEKIAEAKNKNSDPSKDGIDIGGRHYTAKQLEWMSKYGPKPMKEWTKDQKKARNKKNKQAKKSRKLNRKNHK